MDQDMATTNLKLTLPVGWELSCNNVGAAIKTVKLFAVIQIVTLFTLLQYLFVTLTLMLSKSHNPA